MADRSEQGEIRYSSFQTQWSERVGGKGGKSFKSFGGNGINRCIDGIRLWTDLKYTSIVCHNLYCGAMLSQQRQKKFIRAIQLRVNGRWQRKYGGNGGKKRQLLFAEGEYIKSAECRGDKYVEKLVFCTNYNNRISGGGNSGKSFGQQPGADNAQLIDIRGRSSDVLNRIEFKWGAAPIQEDVPKWGQIFGGNHGGSWDLNAIGQNITGVRLYGGKHVDSIEFQVNNEWTGKHGGDGGGIIYISIYFMFDTI